MLCRQVLVVLLASARAWKCPQVECTGWSEAYNNVINGVYLANEATDTAPRWTYTKADAAIHLRFSELHGNAWLVTDSVTAALDQVQTYAYVRPAPTSYPEDANVTAADGGSWFVWSGTAHVSSGFTCVCLRCKGSGRPMDRRLKGSAPGLSPSAAQSSGLDR